MVRLISYPFRIASDGRVATIEDGEDYYAEELAMLVKTIPGERELVPDYGIEDPTFNGLNRVELLEKISLFGPPVDIVSNTSEYNTNGRISITITYEVLPIDSDFNQYDNDEDEDDEDYEDLEDYDEEESSYNFNDATDL